MKTLYSGPLTASIDYDRIRGAVDRLDYDDLMRYVSDGDIHNIGNMYLGEAIYYAAKKGNIGFIEIILMTTEKDQILYAVICSGNIEIMKRLIYMDYDIKDALETPCDPMMTQFLLSNGSAPDLERLNIALLASVDGLYPESIKLLIDAGANELNSALDQMTTFYCEIDDPLDHVFLDKIKILIEAGADNIDTAIYNLLDVCGDNYESVDLIVKYLLTQPGVDFVAVLLEILDRDVPYTDLIHFMTKEGYLSIDDVRRIAQKIDIEL